MFKRPFNWQTVFNLVYTRSYKRRKSPFLLASGQFSYDYIDSKLAIDTGERMTIVSLAMLDLALAHNIEFDAVGGLTMGADPLAHGIAMVAGKSWFSVRKNKKSRGHNRWIEGVKLGIKTKVLLVDDVTSTGNSIEIAYKRVVSTGASVNGAISMVDRSDLTKNIFINHGVIFDSLITYKDLGIKPLNNFISE